MGKGGRRPVLDEGKRREILAILAVGCSRRTAAKYVGCAPTTIQATAERDPAFAEQIARADSRTEIGCLTNIQKAANKEQYWRAAAWVLERRNPDEFTVHDSESITLEQAEQLVLELARIVADTLPGRFRQEVLKRVAPFLQGLSGSKKKPAEEGNET
jgi:hypothetical protein